MVSAHCAIPAPAMPHPFHRSFFKINHDFSQGSCDVDTMKDGAICGACNDR